MKVGEAEGWNGIAVNGYPLDNEGVFSQWISDFQKELGIKQEQVQYGD